MNIRYAAIKGDNGEAPLNVAIVSDAGEHTPQIASKLMSDYTGFDIIVTDDLIGDMLVNTL